MKFLLDMGLAGGTARSLRDCGHVCYDYAVTKSFSLLYVEASRFFGI
jgi:hypothetical protein